MSDTTVVTRFAPSPTGALHIGVARTALFNWAYARQHGGRFVLRMEDTDQARSSPEAARGIVADLLWLGLDWDEGPPMPSRWDGVARDDYDPYASQLGDRGPYFQSQRLEVYHRCIDQLLTKGQAYEDEGAVRFRVPRRDMTVLDEVRGDVTTHADQLEDFVIRKSDGFPTFHLAVVVDDGLMGITHVIRGQDHLSNTPKHLALQNALGFDPPRYAHIPLIFNPDGSKMSKRDKAKLARKMGEAESLHPTEVISEESLAAFFANKNDSAEIAQWIADTLGIELPDIDVCDFRRSGYLPQVLVNYMALLGWSPGHDVERFGNDPLRFIRDRFSLDRIGKSNARFDRDKLFRFNAEAIAELPAAEYRRRIYRFNEALSNVFPDEDAPQFVRFAEAYHERTRTLAEPARIGGFFLCGDEQIAYDPKAVRSVLAKHGGKGYDVLRKLKPVLRELQPWEVGSINEVVHAFAQEQQIGMKQAAQPLRVAVSGGTVSPPIDATLEILGKEATLARIERCLELPGARPCP